MVAKQSLYWWAQKYIEQEEETMGIATYGRISLVGVLAAAGGV